VRVTFLGTGHAFFGGGRGQSAILVDDALGRWLLECGATTPYLLKRAGIDSSSIEMAMVSHLHGDHFAGLAFLLLGAREEEGRTSALHLVGPPQLRERIRDLLLALYSESNPDQWPFPLEYHAVTPGQSIALLGRKIRGYPAHHMSDGSALCLRVETEGKVIAFSGDTGNLAPLAELADQADLFVCECTRADAAPAANVRHLSVADIARMRPRWNARRVVLTHLSEASRRAAEALTNVEVAEDGMQLEL
jgi:ribonuclease BN (tRNA processing enzyme)